MAENDYRLPRAHCGRQLIARVAKVILRPAQIDGRAAGLLLRTGSPPVDQQPSSDLQGVVSSFAAERTAARRELVARERELDDRLAVKAGAG
ncbi:MAG: hypothetical protein QOJ29_3273 [Thermoleophilaceae bacterium]|jgi:hypothetical protein|nr:hypothetical protein [Thermoleophilaceae bacterium]